MIIAEQDLMHYGTPRKSGRYPWGSGGNANVADKRNRDFADMVAMQRQQGISDKDIAKANGLTTTQFRAKMALATTEKRQAKINQAQRLADTGMSNTAIGKEMGINESSVRALLAPGAADKANILTATADRLMKEVDEKGIVDVGSGVSNRLDVTQTKLNNALAIAKERGYEIHTVPIQQLGTGNMTNLKTLSKPGTTWGDVARNKGRHQAAWCLVRRWRAY